jgi:membrane associated rhomboid family serine protease
MASPAQGTAGSLAAARRRVPWHNVSTWLVVACVAMFVLSVLLPGIYTALAFVPRATLLGGQIWRLLGFQFLHADLMHLAFNMLGLWWFGPMVERKLGRAPFLAFYLLCGAAGALAFVGLAAVNLVAGGWGSILVGASAGLFGTIAAAMVFYPNRILRLALPPIDITVFRFGLVYLGLAAYVVIFWGNQAGANGGGEAAHLGGAAAGFLLARNSALLAWADRLVPARLRKPGHRPSTDVKPPSYMKYHGWR